MNKKLIVGLVVLAGVVLYLNPFSSNDDGSIEVSTIKMERKDAKVSLSSLLNTLKNYEELIPIYEEVLVSAEEDLRLAQNKYELGSATNI